MWFGWEVEGLLGPVALGCWGCDGGWEVEAPSLDEARLDALFEEARRGMAQNAAPTRPAPAATWDRPVYDPGIVPSRPFGKRT